MAGPEATAAATHAPRRPADPDPSAEPAPSSGSAALCSARAHPFESPGGASHRPQTLPGAMSSARRCSGCPSPPLALPPPQLEPRRPLAQQHRCVVRSISRGSQEVRAGVGFGARVCADGVGALGLAVVRRHPFQVQRSHPRRHQKVRAPANLPLPVRKITTMLDYTFIVLTEHLEL